MQLNSKNYKSRFILFSIFTLIVILILLWKYFSIMLLTKEEQVQRDNHQLVERGPILDRNGRILAIQTQLDSVTAWKPDIKDIDHTAKVLSEALNINYPNLLEKLKNKSGFIYIKRKISRTESKNMYTIMETNDLPGISLIPEYGRTYPEKETASHIIGYAGTDNIGLLGLEYSFNDYLFPQYKTDDLSVIYGNQIFLTIDLNLQYLTETIAKKAYKEHNADSCTIIILDAKNGNLLSYVSIPEYDPNDFNSSNQTDRINVPATVAYEPGSVFKIFSIASFLELGKIGNDSHFFCNGKYENVDPHINCLGFHGSVTTSEIIKYSCNAGAAYASDYADNKEFHNILESFGFGTKTGLPFPGETAGILNSSSKWSSRSKPTVAFGQAISVSALQMVKAASVLTNQGYLLNPQIISKIVSPEGKIIFNSKRDPAYKVISPEVARDVLLMMETATLENGTARRLHIDGIRISAKTGTAQVLDTKTGT